MSAVRPASAKSADGEPIDDAFLWSITGYALRRTDHVLQRDFRRDVGTPLGLSEVEFALMMLVGSGRDTTQKDLCAALGMLAPALAVVLDRLEKSAIVVRRRLPADRRIQIVALTRDGVQLYDRARERARVMEEAVRARLSPGEYNLLLELLGKLRHERE